jgi:sugar phosphate isomerase/epimerase
MTSLRVGIDSYCLNPLKLPPGHVLEWTAERGGEGVQFSEGNLVPGGKADEGFLRELGDHARSQGLYLEWGGAQHVPFDTTTWRAKDLLVENRRAAESASKLGAHVVRSCSGGFFRWTNEAPGTSTLLDAMAAALRSQRTLFEDCGVTLAIELHFEFTTFELLRLFDMCDAEPGGWLGICLDTFNMLPMLEDPVAGTERVLPWVVSTHVKDGGVSIGTDGLVTFPTELGCGLVDIPAILDLLESAGRPINLSIEDHGGSFTTPLDEEFLVRFPDLSDTEKTQLLRLASAGGERLANGTLSPTDRADWPELCQERTEAGLSHLRKLVSDRGSAPTAVPG